MRRPVRRTAGHVVELAQVAPEVQPALLQNHRPPTFLGTVLALSRVAAPASANAFIEQGAPHCVHRRAESLGRHFHPRQLDRMKK